jgi:hypothetical protein
MNKLLIISLLFLTGCASVPTETKVAGCQRACLFGFFGPGNPTFDKIGDWQDSQDPCQYKGKPEGYKLADFCFANAGKRVYYVRDVNNKIVYTVR